MKRKNSYINMMDNKIVESKKCSRCSDIKPLTDYYFHTIRGKIKPYSECKECTIKRNMKYKKDHPQSKEKIRQAHEVYYSKNREVILQKCKERYAAKKDKVAKHNREYYQSNREYIMEKRKQYRVEHRKELTVRSRKYYTPEKGREKYLNRKQQQLEYNKSRNLQIKTDVITYYGNGKCACIECGFDDIRALSIDHIKGNGSEHRKSNKDIRGSHIYEWLKKNNYPEGYQTLCMNCQLIKRHKNKEYYSRKLTNGDRCG